MEFKKCMNGHFYDPSVTDTCPQCAAEGLAGGMSGLGQDVFNYGPTEPVGATGFENKSSSGMADYGSTEPVGMNTGYYEQTMPPVGGNGFVTSDFGGGMSGGMGHVESYDDATMVTNVSGISGFTPVVGWLVCIDGPAKGCDYRIRPGYNYIGRASHMDICISGDNKIGRERHAMIGYDHEGREFFFGPADGKNIVRLNGKMVLTPDSLKAHDVITIGSTKLMFVPLCGEKFNWE